MPRRPIHGRFCHNPRCRKPIDPMRQEGTDYCDSSCRSQAFQLRTRAITRKKPLRRVPTKPQTPSRAPTAYCVMRKELNLVDGERALLGGFVIVGFCAETNKARAIKKIAAYRADDPPDAQYVAVAVGALTLYDDEGKRVAEKGPDWEVEDD